MKSKIKIKIVFSLILFFAFFGFAENSWAADNHYIRQGATGSNNGSDWTNAWTSLPSSLTRGDTYFIADGSYGGHTFNDAVSGNALITVKKATTANHGTETGWLSSYGDEQAEFSSTIVFCKSYYVFDGVTGGGAGSWDSGHGFTIQIPVETSSILQLADKWGVCGTRQNTSDISVSHVMIQGNNDWSQPLDSGSGWNLTVSNITLENIYVTGCNRGHIITNNTYTNNWTVQNSYFKGGAVDVSHHFINIRIDMGDGWTIKNNIFEDWVSTGSVGNYLTANDIKIYGNVFINTTNHFPSSAPAIFTNSSATSTTNWKIYNNSFIHNYSPNVIDLTDGTITGNVAYNNIFYNTNGTPARSGVTSNYNWYYPAITHGEANSVNGTSDPFVGWTTGNYRLSAATTSGTSLPSPYNADAFGITRGSDGIWDRGAYEYVSGGSDLTPPSAPSGLSVN